MKSVAQHLGKVDYFRTWQDIATLPFLIVVCTPRAPDFVMITRRMLENPSIQVS